MYKTVPTAKSSENVRQQKRNGQVEVVSQARLGRPHTQNTATQRPVSFKGMQAGRQVEGVSAPMPGNS